MNINNNSIIDKREHIILGLIWQIIRVIIKCKNLMKISHFGFVEKFYLNYYDFVMDLTDLNAYQDRLEEPSLSDSSQEGR